MSLIGQNGATLLHVATENNYPDLVDALCHLGADVNLGNNVSVFECFAYFIIFYTFSD